MQCGLEKGEDPLELDDEDDGGDAELARALEADRRAETSWEGNAVQEAGETGDAGETPEAEEASLSGDKPETEDASLNGENPKSQKASLNKEPPQAQDTAEPEGGRRAEAFS